MKEAATALNITPAMQIRYYETIQKICGSQANQKIIFLPFDQNYAGASQ